MSFISNLTDNLLILILSIVDIVLAFLMMIMYVSTDGGNFVQLMVAPFFSMFIYGGIIALLGLGQLDKFRFVILSLITYHMAVLNVNTGVAIATSGALTGGLDAPGTVVFASVLGSFLIIIQLIFLFIFGLDISNDLGTHISNAANALGAGGAAGGASGGVSKQAEAYRPPPPAADGEAAAF